MDLHLAIRYLIDEKKRVEKMIQLLESMMRDETASMPAVPRSRRGRKGMSAEERKQVSERMRKYWASRRAEK
jgi:hypothetical protein